MSDTPSSASFCILAVCTGNICRSPYAERQLRAMFDRLGLIDGVEVVSAGTRAIRGAPVATSMAAVADDSGVDVSGHVARQLGRRETERADLILALTRDHRRDSVQLAPGKSRVSFTLREFGRLAEDARAAGLLRLSNTLTVPEVMSKFVDIVASRRGFAVPPDDLADDDVPDPYGRDDGVFAASAARIALAVDQIERAVSAAMSGIAA